MKCIVGVEVLLREYILKLPPTKNWRAIFAVLDDFISRFLNSFNFFTTVFECAIESMGEFRSDFRTAKGPKKVMEGQTWGTLSFSSSKQQTDVTQDTDKSMGGLGRNSIAYCVCAR